MLQNSCWFSGNPEEFYYLCWISKEVYIPQEKKCTEGKEGYLKVDLKLVYIQNEKFALCLETKHQYGSFCVPKCSAKRLILTLT